MTKYFYIFVATFSLWVTYAFADAKNCDITNQGDLAGFLRDCAKDTGGVNPSSKIGTQATRDLAITIAEKLIQFGALLTIGVIVYAGIQYTMSYGDDEKVKKAKNTAIYGIIGLLLLMLAFPMVQIVVNFIYSLAGK